LAAKVKIKRLVRSSQRLALHFSFSRYVATPTPQSVKYRLGHGDSVPGQIKGHDFPASGCDRGWDTAGHGHLCRATFVGRWTYRYGKVSSRSSSLEAGPRRTCRPIPRSESAGGACGLAQGDARDENRKVADAVDR